MQYRLRTLWLVVAVIGVIVAIALAVTEDLRKRGRLTAELTALGAYYVAFDDNNEPDWVSIAGRLRSREIARYQTLLDVDLAGSSIQDDDLQYLVGLENLERLHLTDTAIGDAGLKHVAGIQSLKILRLEGTKVTDDGINLIASLPNLRGVDLQNTKVSSAGVEKLRSLRPDIGISY